MLTSSNSSYLETFFVVFYLSFYFIRARSASARDTFKLRVENRGGNGTTGWLRSRTRWRLELCTCSSLHFLLLLLLTRIIGICIKVRGGCPLPLLLGLQYLIQTVLLLLLVAILIICVFRVVRFLSFFFCPLLAN